MYSRIPVPAGLTGKEDEGYLMAFFPVAGIVIAVLQYLVYLALKSLEASDILCASLAVSIPLIITGGIHLDGFMDMSDALSSYREKEKRLEILKDPHIGAFAVIKTVVLILICFGAMYETVSSGDRRLLSVLCLSYVFSRIMSGFLALYGKSAKQDGSLYMIKKSTKKKIVTVILVLELASAGYAAVYLAPVAAVSMILAMALAFVVCVFISERAIGGVTGDTAGWALCIAECAAACTVAAAVLITGSGMI